MYGLDNDNNSNTSVASKSLETKFKCVSIQIISLYLGKSLPQVVPRRRRIRRETQSPDDAEHRRHDPLARQRYGVPTLQDRHECRHYARFRPVAAVQQSLPLGCVYRQLRLGDVQELKSIRRRHSACRILRVSVEGDIRVWLYEGWRSRVLVYNPVAISILLL